MTNKASPCLQCHAIGQFKPSGGDQVINGPDLRGVAPKERARTIIAKCAHPDYKEQLTAYLDMAEKDCLARKVGHEPQLWDRAFKMHLNLEKNGTMRIKNWDMKIDLCE